MSVITFDAIGYVDKLIESGFNEPQAKAQVKVLQNAIDETIKSELATKGDIFEVRSDLEKRLNRLEILMSILLAVQVIPILKTLF